MSVLLSLNTWIGAGVAAGAMLTWAVFVHGPEQYEAGGIATAARLDEATNKAAKEIIDAADRADFLRAQCLASGRVWLNAGSQCVEG